MVMVGRERRKEKLCCCEYIGVNGETRHVLACCCDCEALDQAAEDLTSCRSVSTNHVDKILDVVVDRCRLPWLGSGSGARQINPDLLLPIIGMPALIYTATYGPVQTLLAFITIPCLMLIYYKLRKRSFKTRTTFFYNWCLVSVVVCVYVFETVVVTFREILLWENLTLLSIVGLATYCLWLCRLDPGYIRRHTKDPPEVRRPRRRDVSRSHVDDDDLHHVESNMADGLHNPEAQQTQNIPAYIVTWVDSRPFSDGYLVTWCSVCHVTKQPRSGHCTVCNWCVEGRDHHCIWIDSCIGTRNHRSFILAWMLLVSAGFYFCQLTFSTICTPEIYLNWILVPNDCRFVYGDIYNSLSFVTSLYALLATLFMAVGLIHQFVLIGQNLTMQEYHQAGRRAMLRFGLLARGNVNNRGCLRNLFDFWSGTRNMTYDVHSTIHV